jgi:hypothetical protein
MVPTVVFLVGAAGWVHYLRTNTDNSGVTSAAAPRAFTPLAEAARTPTLAQLAPKQERSPVPSGFPRQARRPYPFELPPPRWPETKKNIWSRIHGQRITLGLQEVPLRTVLQELARRTGVPILLDPQVEDPQVSFQISDLVAEAVLRLLLAPRQMGYEIRDDSTVWVTSLSRLTPDRDSDVREIKEVLETLQTVKLLLADGDGMTLPEAGVEKALHDSSMLSPQQPMKAEDWLTLFRDRSRVNIVLDNQARRELGARLSEVRLSPIEEKTFGEHLEGFLKEYGLGLAVTREKVALLTTPGEAEKMNREWNARRKIHDRALLALEEPLGVLRDPSMPDLIDSLESKLRIPVLTTKAVWDATSLNLPSAETTGKDILEHLKAERGFRAALRDGRLYIIE